MNKYIPTFDQYDQRLFENEEFSRMAERYRFDNMKWEFDQAAKDELADQRKDADDIKVYVAKDSKRNLKYTFKTWTANMEFHIQLDEGKEMIYIQNYPIEHRRYFDADCQNILGFKIKN